MKWLGQVVIVAGSWLFYLLCRHVFEGSGRIAHEHAEDVWSFERTLRLPSEARLQDWVLGSDTAVRGINAIYQHVHFPVMLVTLVALYVRRREVYRWFRDVLLLTTGLALVGHIAYPLAPPRLEPGLGMVDTGLEFGQSTYAGEPGTGFTNQLAAMPSMHVAWAALVAVAVIVCLRTRWRWLAPSYAALILFVVVVTGNHYWLDGIVGLVLLAFSLVVLRGRLEPAQRPADASRLRAR
ncbi:phosphatase PAP2 family protein [Aeromicrobium sp. NPDC092404]|uniref:phosphatase PAP2 family protein n=1 Tax=Aeromicrobium sp. NPDC092404 TaxID=3154976 RepID=UPI0034449A0E